MGACSRDHQGRTPHLYILIEYLVYAIVVLSCKARRRQSAQELANEEEHLIYIQKKYVPGLCNVSLLQGVKCLRTAPL